MLSKHNLQKTYKELDEVGVAISVVGTSRQKLMELARLVIPISDALIGSRPEVKRVRDDLVRLAHNVRRAQLKARFASRAVKELALQVKAVQKLLDSGLGDVPETFQVGDLDIVNAWGYTEKELRSFFKMLKVVTDFINKIGLEKTIGTAQVVLDPSESSRDSMVYDLFNDRFVANPFFPGERSRGISDAFGGRIWLMFFKGRDVEVWGESTLAWKLFSRSFHRLVTGKRLSDEEKARMTVSLGRHVDPGKWKTMI
jgi:hypothetical protein